MFSFIQIISKKKLWVVIILGIGFLGNIPDVFCSAPEKKEHKIIFYRNPMGQPDTSLVPKKDSMGMDYIPVYEDEVAAEESSVEGHGAVPMSSEKQQLIGVKTGKAEKRKLNKEIRTVGRVGFDPEFLAAQTEFISSRESVRGMTDGEQRIRGRVATEFAKRRLRFFGMSEDEIGEFEAASIKNKRLLLPFGVAKEIVSGPVTWIYGTVYERDIPFIRQGTPLTVRTAMAPGEELHGEVQAVYPASEANAVTYGYRFRARIENKGNLLKPEMRVDIILKPEFGEKLAVPEDAVMFTGEKNLVFVMRDENHFDPREVQLGVKAGNFYEITAGLSEGENVVVSGNFLMDSESRLRSVIGELNAGGKNGK